MNRTELLEQSAGPMGFKEAMFRAVDDGRKTQTRRILSVQPPDDSYTLCTVASTTGDKRAEGKHNWLKLDDDKYRVVDDTHLGYFSPKYQLGKIYYLPEPVQVRGFANIDNLPAACEVYYPWKDEVRWCNVTEADLDKLNARIDCMALTTARFMRKSFARRFVRVKRVWIERINEISEADSKAEGLEDTGYDIDHTTARFKFSRLWDSINGKREGCSWDANPWVFCYEFEKVGATG